MSSGERAAFAGQITDLPVSELLRTVVHGKQTGLARFETNLGSATLWFREGSIVDADMGRFHMGAAVRRLLTADTGTFEIEFKPISRRRLIKEDTQLLLDSVEPPSPPELESSMSRTGPRRIRPAPGWTPTAGGRGATRDLNGADEFEEPASDAQQRKTLPRQAFAETRRRLEELGRSSRRPSDEALTATVPIGPLDDEDDNLTRVARFPMSWADERSPAAGVAAESGLELDRAPTRVEAMPPTRQEPSIGDTMRPPSHGDPQTPADADSHARALAELRAQAQAIAGAGSPGDTLRAAIENEPSASATAMGHSSHASQTAARAGTRLGLPIPEPRDETEPTAPPANARTLKPSSVPVEPRRPSSTAKMPVQEPPAERRRRRETPPPTDGTPIAVAAEEYSDPIPIGTTWDAPSHLSTPEQKESSARGEIRRRGAAGERTVVPFAPSLPFQETKGTTRPPPTAGATVTDGFRPLAAGAISPKPKTDSYPAIDPSINSQRASSIAATIGLDPSASGVDTPVPPIAPPSAARSGAAPAVVGRYEVLLRIARGGMGTVYLCRVTGAGGFRRLFALKVIRDHLSRNSEYVTMLLQEARIASRLHHPNVVGIVDIGTLANQHYLVMDYVEGCTFSELLKVHRKSRPPQLVIPIVLDALTGLHAAHTLVNDDGSPLTLVHCDFSPQNILVGTNGICRITDFGIARASNALPERSSITRGKPAYLAPEQVLGRPFDHRSDVFAAGVVLWNALTGEQLFGGDTPEEMLEKVLHRPIQPPSAVGLRPPRSLDRVVMRALQRDPGARYQTAEEFLIELRRVAITEDLLAPASEVARWVTDTFGTQLELRRQAAGIAGKTGAASSSRDSLEVSVPELGLGAEASATHAMVHTGSDTQADDMESRTVMLHTGSDVAAIGGDAALLDRRQRNVVFALAATMAGVALALAFMRPGWLLGGFLDEDGTYFEPDPPIELPAVVEGPDGKLPPLDGKAKDGKAVDGKAIDGKAKDGKAIDGKAIEPGAIDGKAIEPTPDPPTDSSTAGIPPPSPIPDPAPAIEDPPTRPAAPKPDRPPKPKPAPKPARDPKPAPQPEPAPEPAPDEGRDAPVPPFEPTPTPPAEDPPPAPPPQEPSLPKPPDLKQLLDG